MMREPQKSFAPDGLHVQVEALLKSSSIIVPSECDSGTVRRDRRLDLLTRKSRKRLRSQNLGFWTIVLLLPTRDNKNSHCQDRDGYNTRCDLQPYLTRVPPATVFDRDCGLRRRFNLTNEPIASPSQRFDEARTLCRVAEHFADLVDGGVEVALDV